ncbi:MAG: adenosylcobinamide-phosphate synthase CbiB [Pseudomonadota bacterium]
MLLALAIEAAVGWPDSVYRRIRHPVVWIGWLVTWLDNALNREGDSNRRRTLAGALAAITVILVTYAVATAVTLLLPNGATGVAVEALIAASLLASRSLYEHVAAVSKALAADSLAGAREAVAHIVGRDPEELDQAGIARAALESLAENTSDGVYAPLCWGLLLGLPGMAAYKAINTLDSMIGHRNARYEHFGKFAARIDDAANWAPARLTGFLLAVTGSNRDDAGRVMWRDARRHRSVNAGWPEAAMAGALGVRLSGPRRYGKTIADEPWLNEDAPDPDAAAVDAGLALYVRAMLLLALLLAFEAATQAFL